MERPIHGDMNTRVDADACPVAIREILFRVAVRTWVKPALVANQPVRVPVSPLIEIVRFSRDSTSRTTRS